MNRHQAREKAFQILYQIDFHKDDKEEVISSSLKEEKRNDFFLQLVNGVLSTTTILDETISEKLTNWTIDRIATAEKTILRIATYEMLYLSDIPKVVSINEAVELAKKYGDKKSGQFVNGVLSKIKV